MKLTIYKIIFWFLIERGGQDFIELRIISDKKPVENAREEQLSLEDLYIYAIGKNGVASNDNI